MIWGASPALAGGGDTYIAIDITTDTTLGDLYVFLGSPTNTMHVTINVSNGAALLSTIIPNNFNPFSTFAINVTEAGFLTGAAGKGGKGGGAFWENSVDHASQDGQDGFAGGDALLTSFNIDIDLDDGFVWGGGGGGGGGSGFDDASSAEAGSGGGGGQGHTTVAGGAVGNGPGNPNPGVQGTISDEGAGGAAGGGGGGAGGSGGSWGVDGNNGAAATQAGGTGGTAGYAIKTVDGASINYSGAKNEATLISEDRLLGNTGV
jgi:hypothetical protein